ncbi:MAG: aminotransferase class V-fold PLP-dependent enzyme [Chitinophagales bacterium]
MIHVYTFFLLSNRVITELLCSGEWGITIQFRFGPDNKLDQVMGLDSSIVLTSGQRDRIINLDNAATTPPFHSVLQAVNSFAPWYGSIHRGGGYKSELTTRVYEEARLLVADFVGAYIEESAVIFVKNTTEAINKVAYRLAQDCGRRNIVISTAMEHHSNDLPWRGKFKVLYTEVDSAGRLRLDDLEEKLKRSHGRVRLVTVTGASNVTGHINPVHRIARLAHRYGAEILVDGAQMVSHIPVKMRQRSKEETLDYLAFSAHKMYAPFGTGVLVGPRETFERGCSELVGGGTVELVSHDRLRWGPAPQKDEAGTPNVMGVVALAEAIRTLIQLDLCQVKEWEERLAAYARRNMARIPGIKMYGDQKNQNDKVGIIPFNLLEVHHETVAARLGADYGIAVRSGCFCAQPYVQRLLGVSPAEVTKAFASSDPPNRGMVRVSFGLYNTREDVDALVKALTEIASQN